MNMCTVQSIKDAIRESCQSSMIWNPPTLTGFCRPSRFRSMSDVQSSAEVQASLPALAEQQKQLKATVFFTKDCGFFHRLN